MRAQPSGISSFVIAILATFSMPNVAAFADDPAVANPSAEAAGSNMVTNIKGTLKGIQRGVLMVTRDDGTEVMVQMPQMASSLMFIADAKPAFLQRGMLVRFKGSFNANGVSAAPIDKIEVFQPINLQNIPGHSREPFVPGVHPEEKHGGKKPVGMAKYQIVGNLMGVNPNGTMVVQAGKIPVTVMVSQTATLQIRYNNLTLAQEGDAVTVAGFYNPPDETKLRGDRIAVTTDRVYGEPEKKTPRRRTTRRTRDTAKAKTDDAADVKKEAASGEENGAPAKVEDAQ